MAGYGTDEDFDAWAADNGYTVPETPSVAVLRQRGSAYLDALYSPRPKAPGFAGTPTGGFAQERAWPRTGAEAHGEAIPSDLVPVAIEQASYFAAYQEAVSPGSLSVVTTTSGAIKREKVGPIETEYVSGSGNTLLDATPMLSAVEGLVAPFLTQPLPSIFTV